MDLDELRRLEEARSREVAGIVDSAILRIMNCRMTREEALELVATVRRRVLELFPDGGPTFDLLYLGRFERTIREHVGASDDREPR